ncbi:MAG: ribosome-associated translation inhibitor RaiA [Saprospiraceae bacterium]
MKVHTESVHFTADQKLVEFIERKLGKLDQFFDRIIDARVYLKLENSGQVKDKVVEIVLSVPGETIVAKESDKTFEAAIDKLTDVLKRQLIKYKDRMREAN